jgi:hypothetical protein
VPADLATYLLVQAVQQLALVLCDDAYDALPGLAPPTPSWFPTTLAAGSRSYGSRLGCPPTRRRLRCPGAFYPGRIPLAEQRVRLELSKHLRTATSATSCRTRTTLLSSGGGCKSYEPGKAYLPPPSAAAPGSWFCSILLRLRAGNLGSFSYPICRFGGRARNVCGAVSCVALPVGSTGTGSVFGPFVW